MNSRAPRGVTETTPVEVTGPHKRPQPPPRQAHHPPGEHALHPGHPGQAKPKKGVAGGGNAAPCPWARLVGGQGDVVGRGGGGPGDGAGARGGSHNTGGVPVLVAGHGGWQRPKPARHLTPRADL